MNTDMSNIMERLRDTAQAATGEKWEQLKQFADPELRRVAETLVQIGEGYRSGSLSGSERDKLLEALLAEVRQRLLSAGIVGQPVIARLIDALHSELFPRVAMLSPSTPVPARGFGFRDMPLDESPFEALEEKALAEPMASPSDHVPPAPAGDGESSLLQELDRAWSEKARTAQRNAGDLVDCSLFAPASTAPGTEIMLQVFVHFPEHEDEARKLAMEQDESANRRGYTTLDIHIERGSTLTFDISLTQATIDEGLQHLRWHGRTAYVAFMARIAGDATGNLRGKLIISQNAVPIGRILFQVKLGTVAKEPAKPTGEARRYRKAFISYASKDRTEVLKRLQMLRLHQIEFFQDVLSLDPGQRWEQELYKHIDEADLFLLFWSSTAKASEWVKKELDYATARKHGVAEADPDIVPVIIEGPPPAPPPDGYDHLHFNDRLIYFMQ